MADDNPTEGGRKSARAKRAKKRDDDVLEKGDDEQDKTQPIEASTTKAVARDRADDGADQDDDDGSEASAAPQDEGEEPADDKEESRAETSDKDGEEPVDPLEAGPKWLTGLFERMNLNLTAESQRRDDNYVFNISGPDAQDLIGRFRRSPRLLSSIQTLLVEHLGKSVRGKVIVDIGGFHQERKKHLTDVADKLSATARKVGKPITVAGLNRFERRIIHRHIAELDDLDTESVDDGIFRKLRVLPQ